MQFRKRVGINVQPVFSCPNISHILATHIPHGLERLYNKILSIDISRMVRYHANEQRNDVRPHIACVVFATESRAISSGELRKRGVSFVATKHNRTLTIASPA